MGGKTSFFVVGFLLVDFIWQFIRAAGPFQSFIRLELGSKTTFQLSKNIPEPISNELPSKKKGFQVFFLESINRLKGPKILEQKLGNQDNHASKNL